MSRKKILQRAAVSVLALTMAFGTPAAVFAADTQTVPTYSAGASAGSNSSECSQALGRSLSWLYQKTPSPTVGTLGGEWSVMALVNGGYQVRDTYYSQYYDRVVAELQANNGILEGDRKYTEYSRVIMAMSALGKDAANVGGYNLVEKLNNYDKVIRQGINGPIFALIALDTKDYQTADPEIRQKYVNYILEQELDGGGFALAGSTADPDITAMAIQGLTPYRNDSRVSAAIDRAVNVLSEMQQEDGGLGSWGSSNSEAVSQAIIALSGLGINPHTDSRFIKNGNSLVDALLAFQTNDGGFMHVQAGDPTGGGAQGGVSDGMATDQASLALIAYQRLLEGKPALYDNGTSSAKSGWTQSQDGSWMYIGTDGKARTGWLLTGGKWYYLDSAGIMQTGWEKVGNTWYYLNADGSMKTGWLWDNGEWYYLLSSGAMLTNGKTPDGYSVDGAGRLIP